MIQLIKLNQCHWLSLRYNRSWNCFYCN